MMGSYNDYWNFVTHLSRFAHDLRDLKEACISQKVLKPETILNNTAQDKHYTPEVSLYLDAKKLYQEEHDASDSKNTI